MELPRYETKMVTVPVLTEVRRRSLPSRLGPWPLKRTRSEADRGNVPLSLNMDEPSEKVNLKTVLAKLDEECATIDKILIQDAQGKTIVDSFVEKENSGRREHSVDRTACTLLGSFLFFAVIMTFVATPLLTFTFANADWGRIYLDQHTPSKVIFVVLLSVPAISVGFVFAMAIWTWMAIRNGWQILVRRRDAALMVGLSLFIGVAFDVWVLAWVLPLVDHS